MDGAAATLSAGAAEKSSRLSSRDGAATRVVAGKHALMPNTLPFASAAKRLGGTRLLKTFTRASRPLMVLAVAVAEAGAAPQPPADRTTPSPGRKSVMHAMPTVTAHSMEAR